jgi:Fur family zinc uptake transcriptional regulator
MKKGLRLTHLRKRVLELVWENHGPVKAYDILDKLGDKKTPAKPPTVYRSLDFLTENGLVHKLNSLNAYVGCTHPSKKHACYFLICKRCREVKECCNQKLTKAIASTSADNNFKISSITLEIEGLCEHCSH